MAVYTVRTREVYVLGRNWLGQRACCTYTLPKDVVATREAVRAWVDVHVGDFQRVDDFAASVEHVEIPWRDEENEYLYNDIMSSGDDSEHGGLQ